jgi:hypothetical protein
MGLVSITLIIIYRPAENNTVAIAAIIGFLTSVIGPVLAIMVKDIHTDINSRMTELIDLTRKSAKAEGKLEGPILKIHHLLNPHCEHCRVEFERELEITHEEKSCKNCQVLRELLESERTNNRMLLEKLLPREKVIEQQLNQPQAVNRFRSPRAAMQQLEYANRIQAAEKLKEIQVTEEVAKLEKELGVDDDHLGATEH